MQTIRLSGPSRIVYGLPIDYNQLLIDYKRELAKPRHLPSMRQAPESVLHLFHWL